MILCNHRCDILKSKKRERPERTKDNNKNQKRKGAIKMKNTNKKTIVKFAAFVIIFALICIAVNFAAGQIMNKEFLSARSIFTNFIFFGRKKAKKNS